MDAGMIEPEQKQTLHTSTSLLCQDATIKYAAKLVASSSSNIALSNDDLHSNYCDSIATSTNTKSVASTSSSTIALPSDVFCPNSRDSIVTLTNTSTSPAHASSGVSSSTSKHWNADMHSLLKDNIIYQLDERGLFVVCKICPKKPTIQSRVGRTFKNCRWKSHCLTKGHTYALKSLSNRSQGNF